MKKQLVATLAAAMILGVAGTSFAASNPFVDVPAKHWSYDSVTKLAQAGVIDGYGDGTFKGDKTVTRYEMAQMVAKAMGNEGKATAAQKAEIQKLQAEYADELDKLGVRVSKLEKNQPNLKFNGQFALRYTAKDDEANTDKSTAARYRLRLEAKATVDENTTFGMRFATNSANRTQNAYGLPKNGGWTTFGTQDVAASNDSAVIDRVFLNSKMGVFNVTAGRQALLLGTTQAIADAGNNNFDGVRITTNIGKVNAAINHGRFIAQKDIDSLELSSKTGKFSYGAGYAQLKDNATKIAPTQTLGKEMLKLQYANFAYKFDNKFSLTGEAGENKADYAKANNKFYNVLAKIGDQALDAKGKQNFVVQYYEVGANALALDYAAGINNSYSAGGLTTLDTTGTTTKFSGLDLSYNRGLSKNLFSEFHYVKIDDKATSINDYDYFRVNLVSKF